MRHKENGVATIVEELEQLSVTYDIDEIIEELQYFKKHITHMQYAIFDKMKLPVGSGQVESAVRRVINLRFKAPGSFWNEKIAEGLMHLRACFKSGRWDEMMNRVITGTFFIPNFETAKI